MIKRLGTGRTTTTQLNSVGRKLFREQWGGVYAVDEKPKLTGTRYLIVNTLPRNTVGEHWVAVVLKNGVATIWDSFARSSAKIIPTWLKNMKHRYKHIDAQRDRRANQKKNEDTCGQLSLAWLLFAKARGITSAIKDI